MKSLKIVLALLIFLFMNQYGHDFTIVEASFNNGELKFGYLLHFLQGIKEYLSFEYFIVHIFYGFFVVFSLQKITKSNLLVTALVLFIFGPILNEQVRFFSSLFLTLLNPLTIPISLGIHPAAGLLGISFWVVKKILHKILINRWLSIGLVCLSFIIAPVIGNLTKQYAYILNYGYSYTPFFSQASFSALILKIFIISYLVFLRKERSLIATYLITISLIFNEIAIISGRTLIACIILLLLTELSKTKINLRKMSFKVGFGLILLLISYYRFRL